MECNRDAANRAIDIAEKCFQENDVSGAKKFALKAQNICPGLVGLPQMLATFDVYLSAADKIMGEPDFYAILGVNPAADEDTLRKQHKLIARMLHPDKNKAVGADGAFKILSEAWSVLSDKTKRDEYDQRRFLKITQQKVPATTPPSCNELVNFANKTSQSQRSSACPSVSGSSSRHANTKTFWTVCHQCKMQFEYPRLYLSCVIVCVACHEHTYALETTPPPTNLPTTTKPGLCITSQPQQNLSQVHNFSNQMNFQWTPFTKTTGLENLTPSAQTPSEDSGDANKTFWTVCHRCKMQFEYLRVYLNRDLVCTNCHEQFHALETPPPPTNRPTTTKLGLCTTSQPQQNLSQVDNFSNQTNFQWIPFTKTTGLENATLSTQTPSVVQQAYEKVRRGYEVAQAAARRQEAIVRRNQKKRAARNLTPGDANERSSGPSKRRNINVNEPEQMGRSGFGATGDMHRESSFKHQSPPSASKLNSTSKRELTKGESRDMLAAKARMEIRKKLNEWNLNVAAAKATVDKFKGKEKDIVLKQTVTMNIDSVESIKNAAENKTEPLITSDVHSPTFEAHTVEMMVPDPDFYDFDRDRSERCFGGSQVWAVYDDKDGMPRYYAIIHRVISYTPFKVKISWLNSKTNNEFSLLDWVGSGFPKICGDFRVGKHLIMDSLNSFSHRVKWEKGARGGVRILPKKGDVWALYRNWSPDWNELTPAELIRKYDMVEMVDDYNEEQGMFVTPLIKVAGFKTVFQRHLDPREVKHIPKEEMFRLSHQVHSYLLTSSEAPDAPKGCCELDPAALPPELLHVIITEDKGQMVDSPTAQLAEEKTIVNDDEQNDVGEDSLK
ncbi:hypothetical protein ACHQM5_010528 [Ranunculus cassubicifolius]